MLCLPDHWTWDFWIADTGTEFHVFFLRASRALHDPERRHRRASIGHAVSTDLRSWTVLADAVVTSDGPAFDDLATWTGSVVRDPGGGWRMFYTGVAREDDGLRQRIGAAVSEDLAVWHKDAETPVLDPDPAYYETLGRSSWQDQAWRDPWVYQDPDGDGWHMLVTARSLDGAAHDRGVVGHARSTDLLHWSVQPPLSGNAGFGQLEVLQFHRVEGRGVVVFSCLHAELGEERAASGTTGGVWTVPCEDPRAGVDVGSATLLTDDRLYAGRLVDDRDGRTMLLAFHHTAADGDFAGGLSDPIPVEWDGEGNLRTVGEPLVGRRVDSHHDQLPTKENCDV